MNVTCDKCNKRYAIADDKVRGKSTVKIRCKQCQNLIAVQGLPALGAPAPAAPAAIAAPAPAPAAPAPASTGAALGDDFGAEERTRAMPAIDMGQTWFAMVNKQQVGPFNARQLEARVKVGEVTLRTYLWKQGMDGWKRASDIPELSPVLAGVSVGATATGPTTSASRPPPAARPASPARDVAVANETPMPEVTGRNGGKAPAAAPAPAPMAREPEVRTDPAQARTDQEQPAAQSPAAPAAQPGLKGLFDGVDPPSGDHLINVPPEAGGGLVEVGPTPNVSPEARSSDPFAALGPVDPNELPPPGEATKFFIAQAGVNKRNPWWKIALFIFGGPIGLVGILFLLSQLHLVPLEVTRTTEDGTEVKENFFSAAGVTGLKDMLNGDAKRKKQAAEEKRAADEAERQRKAAIAAAAVRPPHGDGNEQQERERPDEQIVKKDPTGVAVSATDLARLYNDDTKNNVGPRIKNPDARPAADSTKGGLDETAAARVVGNSQQAFQGCIEEALKRSPNMKVGKITLTVHVGSSGTVIRTEIEPTQFGMSDWGKCLRDRAKRIVFPAFSGDEEAAVQIPLVVGVSVQ